MKYVETPNLFVKDEKGTEFAYREVGKKSGEPIVLFTHLSANLDNWDPEMIDALAKDFWVITFDGKGVGLSSGRTPKTIFEMAEDGVSFIQALKLESVHILGLSMGGMIAQEIVLTHPELVRKLILVGTGPKGGKGIKNVSKVTSRSMLRALLTFRDVKHYLFFTSTKSSQVLASEYLSRLKLRKKDRDKTIHLSSYLNQLKAIKQWGEDKSDFIEEITQPTLIINGDQDIMVPTENSYDLARRIPDSQLFIFEDAGHGSLFQFPSKFVFKVKLILEKS